MNYEARNKRSFPPSGASSFLTRLCVTVQCPMILRAQAGKTVNRKRFLEEYERTVNGFACRSMLSSNCHVSKAG
ncbi:MAG: hypothetical protein FWC60_08875 [Firmicutes bacterium]|nr:hypothetical protein [Bacillota bacterium]